MLNSTYYPKLRIEPGTLELWQVYKFYFKKMITIYDSQYYYYIQSLDCYLSKQYFVNTSLNV